MPQPDRLVHKSADILSVDRPIGSPQRREERKEEPSRSLRLSGESLYGDSCRSSHGLFHLQRFHLLLDPSDHAGLRRKMGDHAKYQHDGQAETQRVALDDIGNRRKKAWSFKQRRRLWSWPDTPPTDTSHCGTHRPAGLRHWAAAVIMRRLASMGRYVPLAISRRPFFTTIEMAIALAIRHAPTNRKAIMVNEIGVVGGACLACGRITVKTSTRKTATPAASAGTMICKVVRSWSRPDAMNRRTWVVPL